MNIFPNSDSRAQIISFSSIFLLFIPFELFFFFFSFDFNSMEFVSISCVRAAQFTFWGRKSGGEKMKKKTTNQTIKSKNKSWDFFLLFMEKYLFKKGIVREKISGWRSKTWDKEAVLDSQIYQIIFWGPLIRIFLHSSSIYYIFRLQKTSRSILNKRKHNEWRNRWPRKKKETEQHKVEPFSETSPHSSFFIPNYAVFLSFSHLFALAVHNFSWHAYQWMHACWPREKTITKISIIFQVY